jgi:hypothetical protein
MRLSNIYIASVNGPQSETSREDITFELVSWLVQGGVGPADQDRGSVPCEVALGVGLAKYVIRNITIYGKIR